MEFEFIVRDVRFIFDAEDEGEALNTMDDILKDVAYDWGQVVLV
jgi:hypothetical protein